MSDNYELENVEASVEKAKPASLKNGKNNKKTAMIVLAVIAVIAILGTVVYLVLDGMGVIGGKKTDKVKELADYKNFSYKTFDKTVSDKDVENYYKEMTDYYIKIGYKVYEEDKSRENDVVKKGDTVNIAYKGFVDGEAFKGGESEAYDLTIGSGAFIEGFEDGLIGAKKGEKRDVKTKFPDSYPQNPDLAGKEAIFSVTVNYFSKEAEYSVENAYEKVFGYKTLDDIYKELRTYLEEEAIANEKSYYENSKNEYLIYIIENTKYDELTKEADEFYKNYYSAMEKMASDYKLTMANLANQYGYSDVESFQKALKEQSADEVKKNITLELIAEKEGIKLSDEKYNEYAEKYAKEAEYDSVSEYAETYDKYYGKGMFRQYILNAYILDTLFDKYAVKSDEVATPGDAVK